MPIETSSKSNTNNVSHNSQAARPGAQAIRVTAVLDYFAQPWKLDWFAKNGKAYCNRVSRAAIKVGTRVDELIKSGSEPVVKDSEEVKLAFNAYQKWCAVYKPKFLTPLTRIYATVEGIEVTGEPDIEVDGVLVDIKVAKKISVSYWIQLNVYRVLKLLADGYTWSRVGILRLDKETGSFEYVERDYDTNLFDVWVGLLRAYVVLKEEKDDDSNK